ncbi:aspartate/glutamate racemase family protein [Sabulicella glaciei]|uniref:Aspartate/glutamate racemase family protein n=1 Tax=Sabulicella glaciei TaxID=2984948 RepID=A0ABT3NY32_9PROT|nr:aspartate/glutamate racemase family protein [Roseococcus sp. MDT2-1-1]MCW8087074.1 aspartate/glutamate racemase family protein [Roseococcus sp. MDT2-1-1]
MKLLLLNGNTDPAITERLAGAARALCPHEVVPATVRFGARYIATRAAAAIAAHAVLDTLAERVGRGNGEGFDAAIIACFGDPGLEAAREALPIPVLGLADSSISAALRVAPTVSLLTGGEAWVPMLREFALLRGHGPDRVRVAAVPPTGDMIAREPDRALALLAEVAQEEAAAGAGCLVLGGAGLVGLAPRLRPLVPVPVLDCLEATLEDLPGARPGTAPMQPAPSVGLSAPLSRILAG